MKETRRSNRLCKKLHSKYNNNVNNIIINIVQNQQIHRYIHSITDKLKNMFNIYRSININIGIFLKYRDKNSVEKLVKSVYKHTFVIKKDVEAFKKYSPANVKMYKKLLKEIIIVRAYYENIRYKKFYFFKNKLNDDIISVIDEFL